jgi:hypothetical protein
MHITKKIYKQHKKTLSVKGGKGPVSLGNKSRGGVTSDPFFGSYVASTQAQL